MSDEFDDLKRAFDAATPRPDPSARRKNIARAEEIFASRQETADVRRLTSRSGIGSRLIEGVKTMLNGVTTRGGLTATTALVAGAMILVTPAGRDIWAPPAPDDGVVEGRPEAPQVLEETSTRSTEAEIASPDTFDMVVPAPVAQDADFGAGDTAPMVRRVRPEPQAESLAGAREAVAQEPSLQLSAPSGAKRLVAPDMPSVDPAPVAQEGDTEAFANTDASPVKVTRDAPVSTFSIDVDTASYGIVRSSLERGELPPAEAVRVEEMINYLPYAYPSPDGAVPFSTTITVTDTPWNDGTELVHIALQGRVPVTEDRPPLNLVFLIDTSGSMQDRDKLPLLKQSFRMMLSELRPEDEVAIVTYAGSAGEVLAPTPASARNTILDALERLEAGGSTAGAAGIEQAYRLAEQMNAEGEIGRVILATDGDFNVGISDPDELKDLIADKRESGTYLSVLGFGRGNLDDATMQALAQNGNGQAAYIDTLSEARKVLVDQLTGALFPIANDVKLQVEFNPVEIAEYRLIGYETRALAREDFNNDRVDAGDIGAGHSVTAIYEVTPVGSPAILNGPLRYTAEGAVQGGSDAGELGYFKLRYKSPGAEVSNLIEQPILRATPEVPEDVAFSIAIAGFGQLLRDGTYLGAWDWDDAIALASDARGADPFGYRAEAIDLMRLAEALSN